MSPRPISYFYNTVRDGRACKTTKLKDYSMFSEAAAAFGRKYKLLFQNLQYKDMHQC